MRKEMAHIMNHSSLGLISNNSKHEVVNCDAGNTGRSHAMVGLVCVSILKLIQWVIFFK